MHSEPTANPTRQRNELRITRRRVLTTSVMGVAATVLVACSQGTSREAERGRERDIERTSIVDSLQSTETARLVSGTPGATPPTTPEE